MSKESISRLKVGINGFGRVGRCLFRLNHELPEEQRFDVAALKDIISIENIAYLLRYDSHYGDFRGAVNVEGNNLVIDGQKIPYIQEPEISRVPWGDFGVNILAEASGHKPNNDELKAILSQGVKNIVYGRNEDDADTTIVFGTNHKRYEPGGHKTISASSCTGNAIVPIVDILERHFGIDSAHFVSIHPALSEQRVLDTAHSKFHLGRSALASIIPVSSGIKTSIGQAFPHLGEKVTAITYRIPTTVVSAIDAHFHLINPVSAKEVNNLFKEYAEGEYRGIIQYDEGFLGHSKVSIDFVKSPYSVVLLGLNTQSKENNLTLALFHDNEWSYCHRFHDLIKYVHERNEICSRNI